MPPTWSCSSSASHWILTRHHCATRRSSESMSCAGLRTTWGRWYSGERGPPRSLTEAAAAAGAAGFMEEEGDGNKSRLPPLSSPKAEAPTRLLAPKYGEAARFETEGCDACEVLSALLWLPTPMSTMDPVDCEGGEG